MQSWELVVQEFVGGLTGALVNGLNQAIPALTENYSANAKIAHGIQLFEGAMGNVSEQGLKSRCLKSPGIPEKGKLDHSSSPTVTTVPAAVPDSYPEHTRGPAFAQVPVVVRHLQPLSAILRGGPDKTVYWNHASQKNSSDVTGVAVILSNLKDDVIEVKGDTSPALALKGIVTAATAASIQWFSA